MVKHHVRYRHYWAGAASSSGYILPQLKGIVVSLKCSDPGFSETAFPSFPKKLQDPALLHHSVELVSTMDGYGP